MSVGLLFFLVIYIYTHTYITLSCILYSKTMWQQYYGFCDNNCYCKSINKQYHLKHKKQNFISLNTTCCQLFVINVIPAFDHSVTVSFLFQWCLVISLLCFIQSSTGGMLQVPRLTGRLGITLSKAGELIPCQLSGHKMKSLGIVAMQCTAMSIHF